MTTFIYRVSTKISKHFQCYNLPELLDVILDGSDHFAKRLIDIGNGRFSAFGFQQSRYKERETTLTAEQVVEICKEEGIYIVSSQSNPDVFYSLCMKTGYCECPAGKTCSPCVHKSAVSKYYNTAEFCVVPETDANMKALLHYVATGSQMEGYWYRPINNPEAVCDVSEFVNDHRIQAGPSSASGYI